MEISRLHDIYKSTQSSTKKAVISAPIEEESVKTADTVEISHTSSASDEINLIKYKVKLLDRTADSELDDAKIEEVKEKLRDNHYEKDYILDIITESIIDFNLLF